MSSLAYYPGIERISTDHIHRFPHIGMKEPAQFHALHYVRANLRGGYDCCGGHLPRVRVDAYPKGADGKAVQHIFRGDIELYRTIHRHLNDLSSSAGRAILWIVKGPLPLLRGHLDGQGVRGCGRGCFLVKGEHTPDEKK